MKLSVRTSAYFAFSIVIAAGFVMPVTAQPQPTPKVGKARPEAPVRRAPVRKPPTTRKASVSKRPRIVPRPLKKRDKLNAPAKKTRAEKRSAKPRVFRSNAKRAGTLDRAAGKKVKFDKKKLGKDENKKKEDKDDTGKKKVQDVIQWKSNLERGVECKKVPLNTKIRFDASDIALSDLTKFISCVTGKNFIISASAKKGGAITILGPKEVTVYEAYKAYLSALRANNLTVVPNGKYLEIVGLGDAKNSSAPMRKGTSAPNNDQVVTRIVRLKHVTAEEITPVLDKFKGKATDITVYAPTNTLFITAPGREIRRLARLIRTLDVAGGKDKIWIRKVQYAEAKEVVTILGGLFGKGGGGKSSRPRRTSPGKRRGRSKSVATSVVGASGGDLANLQITKMLADERTNTIIFVATRANYFQVDRLIRKLDVPIPGEGQIHIHYLENAEAEEIASTLSSLAGGSRSSSSRRGSKKSKRSSKRSSRSSGKGAAALFSGEVKITAYKPTNALVIEASRKDYVELKKVIAMLDVRRKQVYVEAIVMEISQSRSKDVGISGSGGHLFDVDGNQLPLLFGMGGLGLDVSSALSTLQGGGGAVGLQGPMVGVSGGATSDSGGGGTFSIPAFGFLLKALQATTNVNVLSTPHILTLDNEEAEIQVGKRQPYRNSGVGGLGGLSALSGLAGGASSALGGLGGLGGLGALGGLGGLGSMVQYVDVDLTLKITPQVNASDFVRLKIDQSIEDIDGFQFDAPITSKRKVTNTVVVRDGQAVVIGGLMRDQETESVDKVPFLGDIPVLGMLFRRTKKTIEKRNLLLIIIPHVIKDPSDLKLIYEKRRSEYRKFARVLAQRKKEFAGTLDYRKRTGLLHDIHSTIRRQRRARELREQIILDSSDVDEVGPPETHDIEFDPARRAPKAAPAPKKPAEKTKKKPGKGKAGKK